MPKPKSMRGIPTYDEVQKTVESWAIQYEYNTFSLLYHLDGWEVRGWYNKRRPKPKAVLKEVPA